MNVMVLGEAPPPRITALLSGQSLIFDRPDEQQKVMRMMVEFITLN